MLLFNTVICDSRAMLVSHSMDAMPITMEDPWKVARWPNKCRWRYSNGRFFNQTHVHVRQRC